MVEFKDLENKLMALVVWNVNKKNDAHVYVGHISIDGTCYSFKNESKGWVVPIDNDYLEMFKIVTNDLKETLLDADYFINLTITDLVDDKELYVPTGMKWHN